MNARFSQPSRAETGGVLCSGRRQPEHRDGIRGAGGVVHEPRKLRRILATGAQR